MPAAVEKVTEAAAAKEPVRVTVSVAFGPASLTVTVAGENWTVLSSSLIVTVAALVGPSTAPPVGAESVIVNALAGSITVSLMTGTLVNAVPTLMFFGAVSPAAHMRRPVFCAALPAVPKSLPAIAVPLPVVQVTLVAAVAGPERFRFDEGRWKLDSCLLDLASGRYDELSGGYFELPDDLDALLAETRAA